MTFDPYRHEYVVEDEIKTSSTQALGVIAKPALVNWAAKMAVEYMATQLKPGESYDELQLNSMLELAKKAHWQKKTDAGSAGTLVHNWVENYINGKKPDLPIALQLKQSVEKFLKWEKEHKIDFLLSEQLVYSRKYQYTGTLDFICKYDGELFIGDLKTSSGVYVEHLLQVVSYKKAREEEFPEEKYAGILIVQIGRDGSFNLAVVRDTDILNTMFTAFIAALKLKETMDILKGYKWEKK